MRALITFFTRLVFLCLLVCLPSCDQGPDVKKAGAPEKKVETLKPPLVKPPPRDMVNRRTVREARTRREARYRASLAHPAKRNQQRILQQAKSIKRRQESPNQGESEKPSF